MIEFEVLRPNLSGQKICRDVIQFTLDYKCKFWRRKQLKGKEFSQFYIRFETILIFREIKYVSWQKFRDIDFNSLKVMKTHCGKLWKSLSSKIIREMNSLVNARMFSQIFCQKSYKSVTVNFSQRTVWKNDKFSRTKFFFRQIISLVTYLVKTLLWRNFCQKYVRDFP